MITPDQFRVNEAWVTAKINEEFLFLRKEAEEKGLYVKIINESDLETILGPLKETFASVFMRGSA